jgi:hypothetical protein
LLLNGNDPAAFGQSSLKILLILDLLNMAIPENFSNGVHRIASYATSDRSTEDVDLVIIGGKSLICLL